MEKPKIRFLKNKHSWVRNTFEEIAKRRTKSSDNPDLPRIEYQDIISGEGRLNKDLNKNIDCRKGIVFETNDILYGKLRPYLKNWLHPNFNGIALGDFWVLQARNCDSKFLFSLVQSPKFQRVANDTSGTKMPRSDWKTVSQTEFSIPTSNDEQSAIGSLFSTLDDLLASYKDNLTNYQSLKATMLSKMFPKAGQTIPEIRLDGFEGEWEVKELGDVVEFYSGLTYKPSDVVSSGTLVLRSSNVRDGELIYKDNVFVNPDIVNCQYVKLGDIVVVVRNGSRDLIGKHALIKSEMPNSVIGAFMTGVKSDRPEFVNALLDTKVFVSEINKNLGSTINQITTGNFKRMKFSFPTKEEQQAIGSYFSKLDNLINSYQEKISQLETLKKKLLQDMFI